MASKVEQIKAGANLIKNHAPKPLPKRLPKLDTILDKINHVDLDQLEKIDCQEVFEDETISEVVDEIKSIMNKYRTQDLRTLTSAIDGDIAKVSVLLMFLSTQYAVIDNHSFFVSENIKMMDASGYVRAQAVSVDKDINLTGADYKTISRILTKDERQKRVAAYAASKAVSSVYYGAREFLHNMSKIADRNQRG